MDTAFTHLESYFLNDNITFNSEDQCVRYLAHIINLATQEALLILKGVRPEKEENVLENI
jgi:hypothetical protein